MATNFYNLPGPRVRKVWWLDPTPTPAESYSSAALRNQFRTFTAPPEPELIDGEALEIHSRSIDIEFDNLAPARQQEVVGHILEVNTRQATLTNHLNDLDTALNANQNARPIWRLIERGCTAVGNALTNLQLACAGYAPAGGVLSQAVQGLRDRAEGLRRQADIVRQRDPTQAAGGAAQFTAIAQNVHRIWRVDENRVMQAERARRNNARLAGMVPFIGPFPDLPQTWRALEEFRGGMSTVTVYGLDDGQGRIADRVVVKDTMSPQFMDESTWYGKGTERVPIEYWAHRKLVDTGSQYILGLPPNTECRVDDRLEVQKYRMFLAYAPHGDLNDLIQRHAKANVLIPEAFILYIFKALIDTCLTMKRGGAGTTLDQSWEQIVHRDLKPENVFLGENHASSFPAYPQPKLADFGLAVVTTPADPANPDLYAINVGTEGYIPPEQISFLNPDTRAPVDNFRLLSPCNIWGVGATILCLLQNRPLTRDEQPDFGEKMPGATKWDYTCDATARANYSIELCDKVDQCLLYNPGLRPKPTDLDNWVSAAIQANPWLAVQSDDSQPDKSTFSGTPDGSSIFQMEDQHRIGFVLN